MRKEKRSGVKGRGSCMVKKLGIGMRSIEVYIDRRVNVDRYNNECIDIANIHTNDFNYLC
jgi:hypothetical protein